MAPSFPSSGASRKPRTFHAGYNGTGIAATSADLDDPNGVTVDNDGNLVICDYGNDIVRVVPTSSGTYYEQPMSKGDIYTIAGTQGDSTEGGDGGAATAAGMEPADVVFDWGGSAGVQGGAPGNLVIVDSDNNYSGGGNNRIRVVAESTGTFYGVSMTAGNIYTVAGTGAFNAGGYNGDGIPATSAELHGPSSAAVDPEGQLYIADYRNDRIREVDGGPLAAQSVYPFENTTVTPAIRAAEVWGQNGPDCGCAAEGVNVTNGAFDTSQTDLTVPGAGLPLAFSRTYDSLAAQSGAGTLGNGWTDNLAMKVKYAASVATVTLPPGTQVTFDHFAKGANEPGWCPSDSSAAVFCPQAPRILATLAHTGTGPWTYVDTSSSPLTYTFTSGSSGGVLSSIADVMGDTISSGSYSPTGSEPACPSGDTCTAWTSSASGRKLVVELNGSSQVAGVMNPDSGQQVTYTYSGTGCTWGSGKPVDLCSASVPGPSTSTPLVTSYSYDTGNANPYKYDIVGVTPPSTGQITNCYAGGQVTTQSIATGTAINLATDFSYATDANLNLGEETTVKAYPLGKGAQPCNSTSNPYNESVFYFSANALVEAENGVGTPAATTSFYRIDATSLVPRSAVDGDGNVSTEGLLNRQAPGGAESTSADPVLSTDAMHDSSEAAYTTHNLLYCDIAPADFAELTPQNTLCPASPPASPPAPGAQDPYLGMTMSYYSTTAPVDLLDATTDPLGNTTTYAYTGTGLGVPPYLEYCSVDPVNYQNANNNQGKCQPYGSTQQLGTTSRSFDQYGDVTSVTDPKGDTTSSTYTTTANPGLPTTVTNPDGTITSYQYNPEGEVTQATENFHNYSATTLMSYDSGGRKYCEVDPYEAALGVTCPTAAPPLTQLPSPGAGTDPWPGATITFYDANGRVIDTVNPAGGVTQVAYDGDGNTFCTVSPTAYAKNDSCPATPPSTSSPTVGATTDYFDADDRVTEEVSPLGATTYLSYDQNGNVVERQVVSNNPTADPTVTTTMTYDADDRLIASTTGTATTEDFYDPDGNLYCQASPNAVASGSFFCPAWQPGWIAAPPAAGTFYSTSPDATQANDVATAFYDADGRLVQQANADADTTVGAYDGDGRQYCAADANNMAVFLSGHGSATWPYLCPSSPPATPPATGSDPGYTTTIYDLAGRPTSSTDALGDTTLSTYDASGNVLTSTDPAGDMTTYCYYDQASCAGSQPPSGGGAGSMLYTTVRPPSSADPSGEVTRTFYYRGGLPETLTTPAGTTTAGYDTLGDVTSLQYSGTASGYAPPANVSALYNQDGTRSQLTDGTGATSYGYDAAGDLLSEVFTAGTGTGLSSEAVSYAYYSTGALETLQYPSGPVSYEYDNQGNLASVEDWLTNTTSFSYDGDHNLRQTTFPNGDEVTTGVTNADAVSSITLAPTANPNSPLFTLSCQRDPDELVSSETDTGAIAGSITYQYDQAERLSQVKGATESFNLADELTTLPSGATGSYDAAGELTSDTNTSYSYDTIGDRTSSTPNGGATTTYAYDQLGRLTSLTNSLGTTSYQYGGSGLRMGKTSGSTTTTFDWADLGGVPKLLSDGSNQFIYGPGGRLVEQVNGTTTEYAVTDHPGSTRALLSGTTGAVVGTASYDAYGKVTGSQVSPIGFAGGYTDAESGLIYLVNRYDDPSTGQFLTLDPMVAATGLPYQYTGDDPVNFTDQLGLCDIFGNCWSDAYHWVVRTAKHIWHRTIRFVDIVRHNAAHILDNGVTEFTSHWRGLAQIAIVGATAAVGFATGGAGFGFAGGILLGAVSSTASYAVSGGPHSWEGYLESAFIGAVTGPEGEGADPAIANLADEAAAQGSSDTARAATAASRDATASGAEGEGAIPQIQVSASRYPESAAHIAESQEAGQPSELTIDRAGAAARRAQSMSGVPSTPGLDRDEYPPAMFQEGGTGSSVRAIDPSDNRGAGASIGNQCRQYPDGATVCISVGP